MATKWVQKIKDHLARNPLFFREGEHVPTCLKCCGGTKPHTAKRLALYQVTNYSNVAWNQCHLCKEKY